MRGRASESERAVQRQAGREGRGSGSGAACVRACSCAHLCVLLLRKRQICRVADVGVAASTTDRPNRPTARRTPRQAAAVTLAYAQQSSVSCCAHTCVCVCVCGCNFVAVLHPPPLLQAQACCYLLPLLPLPQPSPRPD